MDLSKLPKALVYSLSLVLAVIGCAVAYQIVVGSDLHYDGPLGSIKVGKGQNQTTVAEYLKDTEESLNDAHSLISEQQSVIDRLKATVETYQYQLNSLKSLNQKLQANESLSKQDPIIRDFENTVAKLDKSSLQVSNINLSPKLMATQQRLLDQTEFTKQVRNEINKSDLSHTKTQ